MKIGGVTMHNARRLGFGALQRVLLWCGRVSVEFAASALKHVEEEDIA